MTDFKQVGIEFETRGVETARRDIERVAKAGDKAAAGLGKSERAARGAAKGFKGAGDQAKRIPTTMRPAAGSVGNLTAQFNDIGVMLASGQSPLLLASQQGTQVSQVLMQMRGQGQSTFKALGAGLKSMLGPMQLVTIASIAGGAALVQWTLEAIRGKDAARSFADGLEAANKELDEYADTTAALIQSNAKLADSFGSVAEQVRDTFREIRELDRLAARRSLGAAAGALANERVFRPGVRTASETFAAATPGLRERLPGERLRREFLDAVAVLQQAEGTAQELHATARDVTALGRELIDLDGKRTAQEQEALRGLLEQEQAYGRLVGQAEHLLEIEQDRAGVAAAASGEIRVIGRSGSRYGGIDLRDAEGPEIGIPGIRVIGRAASRFGSMGTLQEQVAENGLAEGLLEQDAWERLGVTLQSTLSHNLTRSLASGDWSSLGMVLFSSLTQAFLQPFVEQGVSSAFGLLGFDKGGTVPGYPGQPRVAVVHGQETIRTPAQERGLQTMGGYGPPQIAVTINATGDVTQATRRALRQSGREIANLAIAGIRERRLA